MSKEERGKKMAHFLSERERACLACLHGDGGLGVAQMMSKVDLYPLLKPWLEWLALEVGVCV